MVHKKKLASSQSSETLTSPCKTNIDTAVQRKKLAATPPKSDAVAVMISQMEAKVQEINTIGHTIVYLTHGEIVFVLRNCEETQTSMLCCGTCEWLHKHGIGPRNLQIGTFKKVNFKEFDSIISEIAVELSNKLN